MHTMPPIRLFSTFRVGNSEIVAWQTVVTFSWVAFALYSISMNEIRCFINLRREEVEMYFNALYSSKILSAFC